VHYVQGLVSLEKTAFGRFQTMAVGQKPIGRCPNNPKVLKNQSETASKHKQGLSTPTPWYAPKTGPHDIRILSIFFGSLLGDSSAEIRSKKRTVRFSLQQENKNVEYLM
jgi:hypothetical protein